MAAATEDWQGALCFTDVGAIVYYLKALPWPVPGFMVEMHLPACRPPCPQGSHGQGQCPRPQYQALSLFILWLNTAIAIARMTAAYPITHQICGKMEP